MRGKNTNARVFREACQACCITVMDAPLLSARSAEVWTWTLSLNSREILQLSQRLCGKQWTPEGKEDRRGKIWKNLTAQKATKQIPVGVFRFSFQKHINMEIMLHGRTPSLWLLNPPVLFTHIRSIEELECCRVGPSGNLSVDRQMRILSIRCCLRAPLRGVLINKTNKMWLFLDQELIVAKKERRCG